VNKIQHFLLVFDHAQGRLLEERHFEDDGAAALVAYVRLTHANYYDGSVAVSKYLAGI